MSYDASLRLFTELTNEINAYQKENNLKEMSIEEVALGFIRVANEAMCRPIRNLTEGKGYDTRKHVLACFGGAGGQHACSIARSLGIKKIIINKYSGILSAYGLSLADVVHEEQEPCNLQLNEINMNTYITKRILHLKSLCTQYLIKNEKFTLDKIQNEVYLNLRFEGTDTGIMTRSNDNKILNSDYFERKFIDNYQKEYGFTLQRNILVDDIWVRGIGQSSVNSAEIKLKQRIVGDHLKPIDSRKVYFDGEYLSTNIYNIDDIYANDILYGPAIIVDKNSTLLIEPHCFAYLNSLGDVIVELEYKKNFKNIEQDLDIIQLSVFSHRFMSIAEVKILL